jgi:transcriptional regulator with XRE-family HTH domain
MNFSSGVGWRDFRLQEAILPAPSAATAASAALHHGLSDATGLTELTGMDRSALSKLETGQRPNPTVETLVRNAEAVGKRLVVSLADA